MIYQRKKEMIDNLNIVHGLLVPCAFLMLRTLADLELAMPHEHSKDPSSAYACS